MKKVLNIVMLLAVLSGASVFAASQTFTFSSPSFSSSTKTSSFKPLGGPKMTTKSESRQVDGKPVYEKGRLGIATDNTGTHISVDDKKIDPATGRFATGAAAAGVSAGPAATSGPVSSKPTTGQGSKAGSRRPTRGGR